MNSDESDPGPRILTQPVNHGKIKSDAIEKACYFSYLGLRREKRGGKGGKILRGIVGAINI